MKTRWMVWSALLAFGASAQAGINPCVYPVFNLSLVDGEPVTHIVMGATRLGSTDDYAFSGKEHWAWSTTPWPDETLVLSFGGERIGDPEYTASFHQAHFPEKATLEKFPKGDRVYALYWEDGEEVGWLVVDKAGDAESALSWILSEESEVDELLDLSERDLLLKPIRAPEMAGEWRAVRQGAL